jgi:hypothetical protein
MSFNVGTPLNSGSVNGPRQRAPTHTDTGEAIEMTSAPVARREFCNRGGVSLVERFRKNSWTMMTIQSLNDA